MNNYYTAVIVIVLGLSLGGYGYKKYLEAQAYRESFTPTKFSRNHNLLIAHYDLDGVKLVASYQEGDRPPTRRRTTVMDRLGGSREYDTETVIDTTLVAPWRCWPDQSELDQWLCRKLWSAYKEWCEAHPEMEPSMKGEV